MALVLGRLQAQFSIKRFGKLTFLLDIEFFRFGFASWGKITFTVVM